MDSIVYLKRNDKNFTSTTASRSIILMIKHNSDLQINTYFKRDVEFLYEKIEFFFKYINDLEYCSIHFFYSYFNIPFFFFLAEGDGHINIWLIVTVAKI